MKLNLCSFFFGLMFMLSACQSPSPAPQVETPRSPSSISETEFQTNSVDAAFDEMVKSLDLEAAEFKFEYKNTGTSVGLKIEKGDEKFGKWVPQNSATDVQAQVVSYWLGRYLQMSENVVPSAYYTAQGRMLSSFKKYLQAATEKNKWRKINQQRSLEAIRKNPAGLVGVFTAPITNAEVIGLANPAANTINASHPIAQFIRATGPMPSSAKSMILKGIKAKDGSVPTSNELQLAKQFSRIMVLDILTNQFDRWSGGNVEATFDKSTMVVRFVARDNGGAGMVGTAQLPKYFKIVSRFDRQQLELVSRLKEHLLQDPSQAVKALRLTSDPKHLVTRIGMLEKHVAALIGQHGQAKVFFP